MNPILSVRDLSYTYGKNSPFKTAALHHIDFDILPGEIVGIIGQTGSGKSTLVQHLNGLIRTETGHIFLDGTDIWENPKELIRVRQKVGLVFQYPEYQLFEETVYEDIAFGPKNCGYDREEVSRRVLHAAKMVGLHPEDLDSSPFDFSGGEKRRIAIAGVLAMEPQILILDEPSAGLDPVGRKSVFDLIRRYRDETGAAILIVSHHMEEMAVAADRLMVLHEGNLKALDTPTAIFTDEALLHECHLAQPAGARLAAGIRKEGISLPADILTVEQLSDALLPLMKGGRNR